MTGTALVTGSHGFIGRHMSRALAAAGYQVCGWDTFLGSDARQLFRTDGREFDVVVHAAAAGAHRTAIDQTPLALAVNLELDAALFTWAARTRPGRVVYLSSSAAYPVHLQAGTLHRPLAEDDIDGEAWWPTIGTPDGIYGWIKLTGERLAGLARDAGVPVTVVRPFSGYGEDQDARFPFGSFAARARNREDPFEIWGTGGQVRDFIHVDDICAATLVMIEQGIDGPVNLGTGRPVTMLQLAGMMCVAARHTPGTFRTLPDRPSGVDWRVADVTRLREFYHPRVSLEEGVARCQALAAGSPTSA